MLLAVFSALCFSAYSQIIVTSATFPAAGDTFHIALDAAPMGVNPATPPGGNQLWDFTSLQASSTSEIIFRPASAGLYFMSYPGADAVVIGQTGETYYNITNNKVEALGYAGADPAGFGLNVLAKFSPPFVERQSPMSFFDITQSETDLSLPFSTAQLPDSLFQGFSAPDSIRVRLHTERLDAVDGWGTCQIPGGSYPVLRKKRVDYVTTNLDVYISSPFPLGWVDLSLILPPGTGGLGNFLGTDTTTTYRFYSGTEKQEIAVATMSNDLSEVLSVQYKFNETTDSPVAPSPGSANIQARPNPAVEWVSFECTNLPQDDYTLKIFNIVGKVVWKENYVISGSKTIKIALEDFKKGTYLYSLLDSKGNTIGTKRLVVLKP
ncbi:MAG: T9SS type A sorting domain-containing protein [Lewinellaceae bacterium]|nr:T9SS type A sorting domain-containing protein [Lewinellaceae bacterium]